MVNRRGWLALALLVLIATGSPLFADDEKEFGWKDEAEFGFVYTDGNAESSTFSLKNTLTRDWQKAKLSLFASATRVETTTVLDRFATGTEDDFDIVTVDVEETTVENYLVVGRYNRDISEKLFWYTGGSWYRNEPSGIKNRYIVEGGLGNVWWDNDDVKFKTTYGLTYTDQEDVVEDPNVEDSFAGARFAWGYENKIGQNSKYENVLVLDANLDESEDWRGNMVNAFTSTVNSRLAIKMSLQWIYDNLPALREVPIVGGPDDGVIVFDELDELDTIFTTSLVLTF